MIIRATFDIEFKEEISNIEIEKRLKEMDIGELIHYDMVFGNE